MFGFPGSSGFGQPAQQPAPAFGAQPASPFRASFGQPVQPAASPFGAATGSAPLFGAQTYGAFGAPAQSAPAFGTGLGSAPSFGATLTPAPAFGAASTPAFGAASTPAFGAASTPTFGATQSAPGFGSFGAASAPAFGAPAAAPPNPFGAATTGFGAMAAPSFGAAPASTGFGAPAAGAAAPFGTTTTNVFGNASAAPSPFGVSTQPGGVYGGFGGTPSSVVNNGTRNVPFSKTKDPDASAGQPQTYLMSMSAMLTYQHPNVAKSHEELRWEDYQDGVKNQNAAPATAAAGGFGAPTAAPTAFGGFGGTTQPAATGFGTTVPANPFAAPASAPAFGATTAPAFGAAAASQPSLFGTVTAPAAASNPFSAPTTASAFGNFGAASSAASQPSIFGSTTTGFGTSAPFGSATPFGGASSAAAFSFNSTPSMFGAASAPATSLFGTAPTSSPFGGATNTLGAVGSPFGAASSASAFGANTFGAFGAVGTKPASPFAPATTTPFGTAAPAAASTSPFGNTFNFNTQPASSPSLFNNTAAGTGLSFASNIFGTQSAAPAAGGTLFGAAGASQPAPVPPPSVAQPAYGNFGALPTVPEPRAGITARAGRNSSISSGSSKASPLLSLRTTPLRFGASVRTRTETPGLSLGLGPSTASRLPASGTSDLLTVQVATGAGSHGTAMTAAAVFGGTFTLPLRQNPHRLFIAAPPPSIEAAGVGYLSPTRLPSAQRASTPDRAGGAAGDDDGNADATATQSPAPTRVTTGVNGYAFGSNGANGSPSAVMASAGQVGGPAFQDSPVSEPHLPRLGRLVSEGFSFTPNVDELRLLHSQNPDNLAAVSNFTVLRAGVGQVRWVVPVDVRGLALYDIVSVTYGEVLCYPDASVKPPQGQGLNKPAEITLYGVYKKDKETGAPIKEGPRGQAYEKLLRQMCGRMGAKFLSYKLDGGVWKFEVEHFSRYGLMDIDEDDDVQWQAGNPAGGLQVVASVEEGVGEAPLPRLLDLDGDVDVATAPVGQHGLTGRGLAGLGLRGFAFGAFGGPAASAADGNPLLPAGEESGMEPSVGARWQQRRQLGTAVVEAGGSEATGAVGPGPEQEMSEAHAQLHIGDETVADGEVSEGIIRLGFPGRRTGAGAEGSAATDTFPALNGDGGEVQTSNLAAPLQHALPESLAHDPRRVRALHDAFFSTGSAGAPGPRSFLALPPQQQQRQIGCTASTSNALQFPAGGVGRGTTGRQGVAALNSSTIGMAAMTAWRRPAAALAPGAPAAVVARGEELLGAAGGALVGSGFGSDFSMESLPLRDVRTAGILTDAGLAMGRTFRVGWGPGGRLVVPGAMDARKATEICVTRVRVEGEGAAYDEMSYGSGAGGAESEEAKELEALRDRLRAGLEVHLSASHLQKETVIDDTASDGEAVVPHWRLRIDSRELSVLVDRHVRVCEHQLSQVQGSSGSNNTANDGAGRGGGADIDIHHPETLRLRHEIETWRLVETLFNYIDGEVPDADDAEAEPLLIGGADAEMSTPTKLTTPLAAEVESLTTLHCNGVAVDDNSSVGSTPKALLAAQQRRAQLSQWLQRQARWRVEEDLQTAGTTAAVVLQLVASHQLAAAVAAAVVAGDPRLAMLIARAGTRASACHSLSTQLAVWQQSGFLEHMVPERLATYQLLAGQVLETQRLVSLDWRRLLGMYLWYGTKAPASAINQYVMHRHTEPGVVPHPAPYHVEGLQPSATGAVGDVSNGSTDVQWELLHLWVTTPAAATADCLAVGQAVTATIVEAAASRSLAGWLSGGGCSRLLRCSGYSPNPLDHSLAWYLMTALQSIGVLPTPGWPGALTNSEDASEAASYNSEMLGTTLEFISQLQLAGGLCEWAVFVALTIPDLPVGGPSVRKHVVRELLAMTVPEWRGDSTREIFLAKTLCIPESLLAEARATWAQYTHDEDERCAALLTAGHVAAAHDAFVVTVAPALFLSSAWVELARLVADLEPVASGLSSWATGGGLYGGFLAIFGRQLSMVKGTLGAAGGGAAAVAAPEGVSLEALHEYAQQVHAAQLALNAISGEAVSDEATERSRLRRRLVLNRISARMHGALMSAAGGVAGGAAAADWSSRAAVLQSGLALQGCLAADLQMGGVAVVVAEAGARVACSS